MGDDYTNSWQDIVAQISKGRKSIMLFVLKYIFQSTIHGLWLERNRRRHGESPLPPSRMINLVDRSMRNRFSSILRAGDDRMKSGLQYWFSTRPVV